jgi:hypothetical protein
VRQFCHEQHACSVAVARIPGFDSAKGKQSGELVTANVHYVLGHRLSNNEPIYVSQKDWRRHCYIIGATGGGKINCIQCLALQIPLPASSTLKGRQLGSSPADDVRRSACSVLPGVGVRIIGIGFGGEHAEELRQTESEMQELRRQRSSQTG